MNRRRFIQIGLATVGVGISGCLGALGPEITEQVNRTYGIDGETSLEVLNSNGDIKIRTWGSENQVYRDEVELNAIKRTRRGREELDKVDIVVEKDDGKTTIKVEYENQFLDSPSVTVDLELTIPTFMAGHPRVDLDRVRTVNGDVDVADTIGDAFMSTTNGDIVVENVNGYLTLENVNGDIEAKDNKGIKKASTLNGEIDVEIFGVREEDGAKINSVSGDITARIAKDMDVNIEMNTTNGDVETHNVELTLESSSNKRIVGRLGEGGSTINIETTNGDIDLRGLDVKRA